MYTQACSLGLELSSRGLENIGAPLGLDEDGSQSTVSVGEGKGVMGQVSASLNTVPHTALGFLPSCLDSLPTGQCFSELSEAQVPCLLGR